MTVGRIFGLGLLAGVWYGAWSGFATETLWIGAVCGAVTAALHILATWHSWGAKALAGLNFEQRQHVLRTLSQGQVMDDPQLWSAHWQHGNVILARRHSPGAAYTALGFAVLLLGTGTVMSFVDDGIGGTLSILPMLVMALVAIFVVVPRSTRYREQVARSLEVTGQKVNQPAY